MKKLLILFIVFFCFHTQAQEWEVVPYEGKTAEEIQKELRTWIALNYRSAQNVIQQDDPGKLIAKGGSTVHPLYDDGKISANYDWPYRYTLHFEVKDDRFRFDVYDILIEPISEGVKHTYTIADMRSFIKDQEEKLSKMRGKGNIRRAKAGMNSNIQGLKEIEVEIKNLKEIIKIIPNQELEEDDW